jgi:hypothetical protein
VSAPPTPRARLAELYAKVDAFFARAAERFPGPGGMTCHAGCDACCRRRFTITAVEAEVIAEGLATLPEAEARALAARAVDGDPGVCPALGDGGRCGIYASRPVICRTHGLPIRFASPGALPVVDACPKNFEGHDLAALPAGAVLDQTTVSTVLGALDAARAAEMGRPAGVRFAIADVLARKRPT